MKTYKKIMDVIAECEKIVMSLVLVFVTVITFVNVLVRKLFLRQTVFNSQFFQSFIDRHIFHILNLAFLCLKILTN